MRACAYLNVVAGFTIAGLLSFAACGGANPPAGAATPSTDSPPSSETSASSSSAPATAPAAVSTVAVPSASAARPLAGAPDRSMNDIRAVVVSNRDAFRACYDRSQSAHPDIKGTFLLKFVVSPDGSIKSAEADPAKSEIHAADLETCAVAVLRGLKFPPSHKGMESTVNYPFDFHPKAPTKADAGAP